MNLRTLRWLSIIAPIGFIAGLLLLTHVFFEPVLGQGGGLAVTGVIIVGGVFLFATAIFRLLEGMQAQLLAKGELERQRAAEWKALFELGEEVTASPDLQELLNSVVQRARKLLGTDVALLMLLSPDRGELEMAAHAGLRTPAMQKLRLLPQHGLQGLVVETGKPVIVEDYQTDPRLQQRPAKLVQEEGLVSQIAVPFSAKGRLLGTLTVGNRRPTRFTERQAELLAAFANWAAVAVETSRLYQRVESLARLEERERIGMDLHDGVIQSIYAVGLNLEECAERVEEAPQAVRQGLDQAIEDLNKVIRDIRNYIFDLRPAVSQVPDLPRALHQLVNELKVNTLIDARLEVDGALEKAISEEQALALFHIAQEALANVSKHARASSVTVRLSSQDGRLSLVVADNGVGFDPSQERDKAKQGLRNMMDRARSLGARLAIDSAVGQGTRVAVEVPPWPGRLAPQEGS